MRQAFRLSVFLILLSLSYEGPGQEKKYVIPFQLTTHNNLSVEAVLNKKDTVHLMFHSAANSLTLTEEAIQKIRSLQFDRTDTVKSWGGGGNAARFSKNNSLQIGEMRWEHVPLWENVNSGQNTDGKFGIDLFVNKVIEIDFIKSKIIISTSLPARINKYEKLKLLFENDNMFVEGVSRIDNRDFKNKFLIHTGYSGAVLFDDKFCSEYALAEKLKIVDQKELKDSYGNVLKTQKAILPVFNIGNEKLLNVPVGFFTGAIGRQKMSVIGGDVLKRFNIIIDAKREYIYLKGNKLKKMGYFNA